jgi:ubiquinone/menaquinone biosynthesis C-methylase UbiE
MIEKAKFSLVLVTRDEYPLKLGKSKEKAFKALCVPIRSELQQLKAVEHYHPSDAAECFEDIINEGFMVKQLESGEMEVPYNVYKYVVARRSYEDEDLKKDIKHIKPTRNSSSNVKKLTPIRPIDVKQDPVIFDTWIRMKPAASEKIVNAVKKQIKLYRDKSDMKVLDAAPSPYAETAFEIASDHPSVSVDVASRSMKVVESIREKVRSLGLSNLNVKTLDSSHLSGFKDKTFDIVICSFGLTFLNSPEQALSELRRVLKPGGSLIISVWEDLCLSQLSDFIVDEMQATGSMEDFAVFDTLNGPDGVLHTLQPYAKPHALENLIIDSGFNLTRVDHETARILLSDANSSADFGVNVATLPIRPFLQELEKSGENKHAFEGARKAFQTLMNDPSLVSHDKCGNAITTLPSRFKLVTATRPHEDSDGYLDNDNIHSSTRKGKKIFKFNEIPK